MSVLAGIDPQVPITLLPVRIETRFAGPSDSPRLQVRLYPDDVHLDRHDPRLTQGDLDAGKRYWTSIRAGDAGGQAWAQLVKDVGPMRAIWVRQALTPTNRSGEPQFDEPPDIVASVGVAPTARALPQSFIVRVRHAGGETIVEGQPIPPDLKCGISFGQAPEPAAATVPQEDGTTLVLDEAMRWMVDFKIALAVGMAVSVDLPPNTEFVDEVAAVGVQAAGSDGASSIAALVEAHRLSDGATFIPPGTPTNNLADSPSGYSTTAVAEPPPPAEPPDTSAAAILARAWSLDPTALGVLEGGGSLDLDEAQRMSRALFEATWGSYLRQQAQPGFDLDLLPQVYAHVTSFVRGGGPLPAIRLGRQPYAIAPILAQGRWSPLSEGAFVDWLANFLPRIRPLWTAGVVNVPSGPDLFAQEPVSTRVRLRTSNMSSSVAYLVASGNAILQGNEQLSERELLAELGFTTVMPSAFTQFFTKGAANLWLPISADGDTEFDILSPTPKDATSVLGLLLRNSALRIAANAMNEFAGLEAGQLANAVARVAMPTPIANLSEAAGHAVPALPGFAAAAMIRTAQTLAPTAGKDASGNNFMIGERLSNIVANPAAFAPDYGRYFNSDALAAFRDALKSISGISSARRAVLCGEIIDCASHRYDAWMTSLATARLAAMQTIKKGAQLGAWGSVRGIQRRQLAQVSPSDSIPEGTGTDPLGGGFVMAPSPRQASAAGVLRAAWRAHGGTSTGDLGPFATRLTSAAVRQALKLAEGMRSGQQLGALLGYLVERAIHDASGVDGIEIDWVVYELRRQYPLKVDTADNAPQASAERLIADGWKIAKAEMGAPGFIVAAIPSPASGPGQPTFGTKEKEALQQVIATLLSTLDAFADLGLAESMYQLAGANLERAAAAADILGRASSPPDVFELASTPRGGRGIEQRVVIAFGDETRPAGFAIGTPRARLAPGADAFVARRLGAIDGIHVRLLDPAGAQVAAPALSSLGLSALDIAALDLSSDNVTLSSVTAPETMPGAPNPNPGRAGVARLLLAAKEPEAVSVGFDLTKDGALLDLLDHAAAWHHALAARKPLSADTFLPRAALQSATEASTLAATVAALTTELGQAPPVALSGWGIGGSNDNDALAVAAARVAAVEAASDPVEAAAMLLGGPAVIEGSLTTLPDGIASCIADQEQLLGASNGVLARWVQDSARVRDAIASLAGALLRDDLAWARPVSSWAAQSPAEPYAEGVDPASVRSWVGLRLPAALGAAPVTSAVIIGDYATGVITGIELDSWTEVIPNGVGTGAVAANLAAPNARAPNVILLAVPPDTTQPWTEESLFSVVDEALELADCRMVDLDATKRVPALLPAIYVAEYDEDDLGIRHLIQNAENFPTRWVAKAAT